MIVFRSGVKFTVEDTIPYVEFDPLVQWSEQTEIDGQPPEGAALFVFRGKRAVGVFDPQTGLLANADDIEAEDYAQVARVSWRAGFAYGSVYTEEFQPTFFVEEILDPRLFGLPYAPMNGDWTATGSEQFKMQCVPLNAIAFNANSSTDLSLEESWRVLYTLLNSTGTTPGYTGSIESNPVLVPGEQGTGDSSKADVSLGIPSQLLSPPQFGAGNFREPFERVAPAGTGLSLGRYAWLGAMQAEELISGIIGARGLHVSLRGGRFGVDVLRVVDQAEVDVEILESDLHGRAVDPRSTIPTVGIRATGQIDKIELDYAWNPIESSDSKKLVQEARDPGSRNRQGNLTHNVREPGLVDISTFIDAGDLYPTPWEYQWRQWWAVDRASFYARRHFKVTLNVARPKGQDLWPGTYVRLTSPWIVSPAGRYGVTQAVGLVLQSSVRPKEHSYTVEVMVFSPQFAGQPVWGPIGRVQDISGTSVTLYADADFLAHGRGSDALGFTEPPPVVVGGQCRVCLLTYDRARWVLHYSDSALVASIDADTHTVTLVEPFDGPINFNLDTYLIALEYDDQTPDEWVRARVAVNVLDTHQFGSGPTTGSRLV